MTSHESQLAEFTARCQAKIVDGADKLTVAMFLFHNDDNVFPAIDVETRKAIVEQRWKEITPAQGTADCLAETVKPKGAKVDAKIVYEAEDGEVWRRCSDQPDYIVSNEGRMRKFVAYGAKPGKSGPRPQYFKGVQYHELHTAGKRKKHRTSYLIENSKNSAKWRGKENV